MYILHRKKSTKLSSLYGIQSCVDSCGKCDKRKSTS